MPENVTFFQNRAYEEPNQSFKGRGQLLTDMDRILLPVTLSQDTPTPRTYVLRGPGGIGKTQTAAHFFHTRRKSFDAAFWVQATCKDSLSNAFDHISEKLGMYHRGSDRSTVMLPHRGSHVLEWLRTPEKSSAKTSHKLKWLLVFDNVNDEDVLKHFWPYHAPGSVLVTTRLATMHDLAKASDVSIELQPLTLLEAVQMLKSKLPHELLHNETDGSLQRVSQILGCWPLAIAHMSGQMKKIRKSPSDFLRHCESIATMPRRFLEGAPPLRDNYQQMLSDLWSQDKPSSPASRLLSVLSLLMPEEIPESILICFQPEQIGIAFEGYPKTRDDYDLDIYDLIERSDISLVRTSPENPGMPEKPGVIHIHSFIQEMIRSHLRSDVERLCDTFNAVVELLLHVWPHEARPLHIYVEPNERSKWAVKDELIAHLGHMRQMYELLPDPGSRQKCTTNDFLLLSWEVGR